MAEIIKITPRARRLASEKGINISKLTIQGTGFDGGICERDILEFLKANEVKTTPLAKKIAESGGVDLEELTGTGVRGKITKADVVAVAQGGQIDAFGKEVARTVPYAGIRKIIGDRLSESMVSAPHIYLSQKVNLEKLLKLRSEINAAQEKKTSVTDYIAMASVIALKKYPEMNSSLIGDKIYEYKNINIGIAVAAPTGLIVPVVKHAEQKKLLEISRDATALFEKAKDGKLTPDEYTGGTFTISNLGMFGIESFTAIINPPEVGILAVSATKDEPFVETDVNGEKTISIKPMMNITLSADHRVIDGLLGAQVVTEIKRLLEAPIELML